MASKKSPTLVIKKEHDQSNIDKAVENLGNEAIHHRETANKFLKWGSVASFLLIVLAALFPFILTAYLNKTYPPSEAYSEATKSFIEKRRQVDAADENYRGLIEQEKLESKEAKKKDLQEKISFTKSENEHLWAEFQERSKIYDGVVENESKMGNNPENFRTIGLSVLKFASLELSLLAVLVFYTCFSQYRFYSAEGLKAEHIRLGFIRIRAAAHNFSDPGFRTEVRRSLCTGAFTPTVGNGLQSKQEVLPGYLPADIAAEILDWGKKLKK